MVSPHNESTRPRLFPQAVTDTPVAGTPAYSRRPRKPSSRLVPQRRGVVVKGQTVMDFDSVANTERVFVATRRTRVAGTPPPTRKSQLDRPVQGVLALDSTYISDAEGVETAVADNQGDDSNDDSDDPTDPAPSATPVKPKPGPDPEEGLRVAEPRPEVLLDAQTSGSTRPRNPFANVHAQASGSVPAATPGMQELFGWPTFAPQDAGIRMAPQDYSDPWSPMYVNPKVYGKPKYGRDYAGYDLAQKTEKPAFMKLLAELCQGIQEPQQIMGRPRMSMADMVYATVHKVYTLFSLRRFTSDLREAQALGYIDRLPNFNTVCKYMGMPEMTAILMDLVTASAIPMKDLETQILFDSTGFSTSRFVRWFNKRWGKDTETRIWVKAHFVCGARTQIITAVQVTGFDVHDTNMFVPLLETTMEYFDPESLAADKAYSSHENVHLAMLAGVVPYIPFKSNTRIPSDGDGSAWAQMYHFFRYQHKEFNHHYHQRSNVETAVSMMKTKFGDAIRSQNPIAQANEILAKVLCHNIVEVHKASVMLGVDPAMDAKLPSRRSVPWAA